MRSINVFDLYENQLARVIAAELEARLATRTSFVKARVSELMDVEEQRLLADQVK